MTPEEIEAEVARLRAAFRDSGPHDGWRAVAEASLRAQGEHLDILRDEIAKGLAWHATPGGTRPNHPPELAGCPTAALRAILRMLPKDAGQ